MKLVLASHTTTIGGAELVLLELVAGLVDRGVTVDVILPGRGVLGRRLEAAGARTWRVHYEWWAALRRSPAAAVRRSGRNIVAAYSILTLLRRLRPDVVMSNTLTIPSAAVAAKVLRIPHVWYLHEFGQKDHGLSFDLGLRSSVRLVNWLSARIIVNSHAIFDEFSRYIPSRKLRIAYCGVDVPDGLPQLSPPPERPFRLVLVGMKTPSKGQEDAIRAVGLLRERERDIRLVLVGHSSREYALRLGQLARDVRADDVIDFVDFTEDRYRYFQQAHAALMCSRSEAFGRVTVEAMKLGLPVIGTNSGGTPELIRDGGNGLLYPYGDPSGLAERIDRLYWDRELRERLGSSAREWARATFSVARHTKDVMGVLAEISSAAVHNRKTSKGSQYD
jgi:glycosyltransferase involved in cell wall biosynthesis